MLKEGYARDGKASERSDTSEGCLYCLVLTVGFVLICHLFFELRPLDLRAGLQKLLKKTTKPRFYMQHNFAFLLYQQILLVLVCFIQNPI